MKRYDCYYTNDFNSEYPALSRAAVDGDWVSFEDAQAELDTHLKVHLLVVAENKRLRDELTAANLERDALRTGIKTLQSTCCGTCDDGLCHGCKALLKLLEQPK